MIYMYNQEVNKFHFSVPQEVPGQVLYSKDASRNELLQCRQVVGCVASFPPSSSLSVVGENVMLIPPRTSMLTITFVISSGRVFFASGENCSMAVFLFWWIFFFNSHKRRTLSPEALLW